MSSGTDRSAYVEEFDYDVFVSYARVDDEFGWVSTFNDHLQRRVNQKLGRIGAAKVFFDTASIGGNEPLTPKIQDAIAKSATLVVVLSPGYLASSWCMEELRRFATAVGKKSRRIFLISYDRLEIENKPEPVRDLTGFDFFTIDAKRKFARPLEPDQSEFKDELYALRVELARQLIAMREQKANGNLIGDGEEQDDNGGERFIVFLAEAPPGMKREYRQLETFLTDTLRVSVFPHDLFHHAPDGYDETIDGRLKQCALFLQMFSEEDYALIAEDAFPKGFGRWLNERALALKSENEILLWRDRELTRDDCETDEHAKLVFGNHVIAADIEELQHQLEVKVHELKVARLLKAEPAAHDEARVLLRAKSVDSKLAKSLGRSLEANNVKYKLEARDIRLVDAAAPRYRFGGIVLYYGGCGADWIDDRVDEYWELLVESKGHAPPGALVYGPPPEKEEIASGLSELLEIRDIHSRTWNDFLETVKEGH